MYIVRLLVLKLSHICYCLLSYYYYRQTLAYTVDDDIIDNIKLGITAIRSSKSTPILCYDLIQPWLPTHQPSDQKEATNRKPGYPGSQPISCSLDSGSGKPRPAIGPTNSVRTPWWKI